jgi:hypothetical protein
MPEDYRRPSAIDEAVVGSLARAEHATKRLVAHNWLIA